MFQSEKLSGLGGIWIFSIIHAHEKQQLAHRVSTIYVQEILAAFNAAELDALTAAERLHVSLAQLYRLRHQWLKDKTGFVLQPSGGDHKVDWPAEAHTYLAECLPLCKPLNIALLSDELARRFDFHRSRAAVLAYVRQHFPLQVPPLKRGPKPRRRWECAAIGELWQHDSSPHPWWPADKYQTLILTIDDHSRKIIAGRFVPSDTTWSHFAHFRPAIETYGPPAALYTDGLTLFGHTSTADRLDTHSQFQRAFTAIGVAHRVAPDAQAKGKIERRFGIFQNRLVTLLAYEKITDYKNANAFLQTQISWHNAHHVCRTTGQTPDALWNLALKEKRNHHRQVPSSPLLDLHFAIYLQRRLNTDYTLDFLGRNWSVTPVPNKIVTIVHHPEECFWVVPQPPDLKDPVWPNVLAHYRL